MRAFLLLFVYYDMTYSFIMPCTVTTQVTTDFYL